MKSNKLPKAKPSTFLNLKKKEKQLLEHIHRLRLIAAEQIKNARKGTPKRKLEQLLKLSRNTYYVAENPDNKNADGHYIAFSIDRLADIHDATIAAVVKLKK